MTDAADILVLIADNDSASRQHMADIVGAAGFRVVQAIDGGAAMKVIDEHNVDLAIVEYRMGKVSGLEFVRALTLAGRDIPVILMADDPSTDLLIEAGRYEIKQVMRKPVDADRLTVTVRRVLKAAGKDVASLSSVMARTYTPEELMSRVIALAQQNARSRMGGPFGAIVADEHGRILGEGVNNVTTRSDPIAHAEVMAIRRATERLGKPRLEGCTVYCSSEPTMLGQALIISTGIKKVCYGLSHAEVGATRAVEEGILGEMAKPRHQRSVAYEQIGHDEALAMFKAWQSQDRKVSD